MFVISKRRCLMEVVETLGVVNFRLTVLPSKRFTKRLYVLGFVMVSSINED